MKPEDINQSLHQLGYSQTLIAEVMGKSPSLISKVIAGKAKSFVVANFIATILKQSVDEVFPNTHRRLEKRSRAYTEKKANLEEIYLVSKAKI